MIWWGLLAYLLIAAIVRAFRSRHSPSYHYAGMTHPYGRPFAYTIPKVEKEGPFFLPAQKMEREPVLFRYLAPAMSTSRVSQPRQGGIPDPILRSYSALVSGFRKRRYLQVASLFAFVLTVAFARFEVHPTEHDAAQLTADRLVLLERVRAEPTDLEAAKQLCALYRMGLPVVDLRELTAHAYILVVAAMVILGVIVLANNVWLSFRMPGFWTPFGFIWKWLSFRPFPVHCRRVSSRPDRFQFDHEL